MAINCQNYSIEKFDLTVPHCLDMSDGDLMVYPDGNPVAIVNGNGLASYEVAGSFSGQGCVKFVPPNPGDLYTGLGNFNFQPGSVGSQMNMRYLIYWGYDMVQSGVKLNIFNDGVSERPMVISRELRDGQNSNAGFDYLIPIPSQNVNEAPTVNQNPDSPEFCIAGAGVTVEQGNYAHQWVCWEMEIITGASPILNFYIHTPDGVVTFGQGNPFATHAWTGGVLDLIRAAVGWYWGPTWNQTPEAYIKLSDVAISNSYIGPPDNFLTGSQTMGTPAENTDLAIDKYRSGKQLVRAIKQQLRTLALLPAINRYQVIVQQQNVVDLVAKIDTFWANANTNGVTEQCRAQEGLPVIDLEIEWAATRAALVSLITWVTTNFPTAANGNLAVYGGWQVNGAPDHINLTAGQLTAYKAQLNAAVATMS